MDVETAKLYQKAKEKFDIFHVAIEDSENCYSHYASGIRHSFGKLLGNRLRVSTLDMLPRTIIGCLKDCGVGKEGNASAAEQENTSGWGKLFSGLGTVRW